VANAKSLLAAPNCSNSCRGHNARGYLRARRLGADYFIPEARSEVTFICVCAAEVAFAGANDFFVTRPLFIVMLNRRNVRQGHSSSPFFASVYDQNTLEGLQRGHRVVFASLERKIHWQTSHLIPLLENYYQTKLL
jgi:hypothetical protein